MGNNITDRLKYKKSVAKFLEKYRNTKTSYKFGKCKKIIYKWREKYKKFKI
ncbi:unknown [Clostridium sp. CAG:793]|nr:unknown [Clostridium sp. CAG:793]